MQAVIRNPLAEPGLLGVAGGAGVAAVGLLILVPAAPRPLLPLVAFAGALAALGLLVAVAYRKGGFDPVRVVLVGIGILAAAQALVYFAALKAGMALAAALTWMSGSTYARSSDDLVWLALPMLAAVLLWLAARPLDLLALGEDLPRSLGLPLNGARMAVLSAGALLAGVRPPRSARWASSAWWLRTWPGAWSALATGGCCPPRCCSARRSWWPPTASGGGCLPPRSCLRG
ncbi:hypothetical protein GCM10018965_049300 [Nonomuraea roseola]